MKNERIPASQVVKYSYRAPLIIVGGGPPRFRARRLMEFQQRLWQHVVLGSGQPGYEYVDLGDLLWQILLAVRRIGNCWLCS